MCVWATHPMPGLGWNSYMLHQAHDVALSSLRSFQRCRRGGAHQSAGTGHGRDWGSGSQRPPRHSVYGHSPHQKYPLEREHTVEGIFGWKLLLFKPGKAVKLSMYSYGFATLCCCRGKMLYVACPCMTIIFMLSMSRSATILSRGLFRNWRLTMNCSCPMLKVSYLSHIIWDVCDLFSHCFFFPWADISRCPSQLCRLWKTTGTFVLSG